jgi:hypothetical protein
VSDEEWSFAGRCLMLMDISALQRKYDLRELFNARRWIAGAPPVDATEWLSALGSGVSATQRERQAGCFENMVCDLRSGIRVTQGCQGRPGAVILDRRIMLSTCESGPARAMAGINADVEARSVLL